MIVIRFTLEPGARLPTRGSAGASGYDLYAGEDATIYGHDYVTIGTGVAIELPDASWEAQIRPRSGMSKRGLIVPLGTIDSDYRGPLGVLVVNATSAAQPIKRGDRIAQLVLARVEHPAFDQVAELAPTSRGTSGWGSSGR